MNFKAKVIFGNDTRVWRNAEPTFSGLLAFVQGAWGHSLPNQWKLQYLDTDGDNVTITSEMDLADCVQTASENQDKGLRIVVSEALPSGQPTVVATPVATTVAMDSGDDLEYEIVRGGSEQSKPEEAVDQFTVTKEEQPEFGDEKEEPPTPEAQARSWAEERINAGRVPTAEQMEERFKIGPLQSSTIIHLLTPAIHDLLALQAAASPEGQQPAQKPRPPSPSGMDTDELRAKLMSLGFNIQGNEEALRTAVRALTNPNIVIDATAYVENPAAEGATTGAQHCSWRDIVKQFVEDNEATEALTGPFVDVLYAALQEGEDTMVAIQSAVASDEHLADTVLVKKLMPFLSGYADKLTQGLQMITMLGADALRNLLNTVITTARTFLSGQDGAFQQSPLFGMFPGIQNVFKKFAEANSVPEVRRDEDGHVVHMGVICDGCGMDPLTGDRFKATARQDYDLCGDCEKKRDNPQDPMIKYALPASTCSNRLPGMREAFRQHKHRARNGGGGGGNCGGGGGNWRNGGGGNWRNGGGCGRRGRWGKWAHGHGHTPGGHSWSSAGPNNGQDEPRGPPNGNGPHNGPPHGCPPWARGMMNGGWNQGPWNPNRMGAFFQNMFGGQNQNARGQNAQNNRGQNGQGRCPFKGHGNKGQNTTQNKAANSDGVSQVEIGEYKVRNIKGVQEVVEARYGDLRTGPFSSAKDVTAQVQKMVGADGVLRLTGVKSLNQHFGDPAIGVTKKLRIRYIKGKAPGQEEEVITVKVDQRPMGFRYDGVRVTNVWNQGAAYKAGLREGSTILMVNGQDVNQDNISPIYRSAPLPFDMVVSRMKPAVPTKVKKLDSKINQMSRQMKKCAQNLKKTEKVVKKGEKEIAKHKKIVEKQQKQLEKQQKKLEKGKGGSKLPEKVCKTARQLNQQAAKLEKRKVKHAEFVQRLENKKAKMQSKLKKMEDKLHKMSEKREQALQNSEQALQNSEQALEEEPAVQEEWVEDSSDDEAVVVEQPKLETDTESIVVVEAAAWECSCGMHNDGDANRCGSCGEDQLTAKKADSVVFEEPPSDDDKDDVDAKENEEFNIHVELAKEPEKAEPFHVAADHPYYEQNIALVNMGFIDEVHNIHLLAQCDGKLQQTISQLVEASVHNI